MINQKVHMQPDYKRIYSDLINLKFSDKEDVLEIIKKIDRFSFLDITKINKLIFENSTLLQKQNQKFRSYDKATILRILDYQKKERLNNTQLGKHFNISRNTISKWKSLFIV